jgi:hypothetical protein
LTILNIFVLGKRLPFDVMKYCFSKLGIDKSILKMGGQKYVILYWFRVGFGIILEKVTVFINALNHADLLSLL